MIFSHDTHVSHRWQSFALLLLVRLCLVRPGFYYKLPGSIAILSILKKNAKNKQWRMV